MKNTFLLVVLFFLLVLASCKTLHLGGGVSYNNGNSGGCDNESGIGVQVESSYYFNQVNGPGISLELHSPGYTDCNDGDPLIFFSPQVRYRQFIRPDKLAITIGAGYATGIFIDPGYLLSGGVNVYSGKKFYLNLEQNYYKAFDPKENAILPGTSTNISTQISIGIRIK